MSDPYRRDSAAAGQAGDPLAELARLIGQNDPFADLGRPQRPAVGSRHAADWHSDGAETPEHQPAGGYAQSYSATDAGHDAAYEPAAYAQQPVEAAPYPHDDQHGYQQDQADPYQPAHDPQAHDPQAHDPYGHGLQAHDAYDAPQGLHADASQAAAYGHLQQGYEPAYDQHDYAYRPQQDYDAPHAAAYDEPAAPRRRGGLVAVMGVVALAVVGTAGAYGYRAMFGTAGSSPSAAPVIKAAETPNKVQVASAPDSTKLIQDRLTDRPQAERVVPREERPVDDVRTTAVAGKPNIVTPRLLPPNTAPASGVAPVLPQVAASAGPGISAEPKKIRTVAIRQDADGTPRAQGAPPSPPRSAAPQSASAAPAATAESPFPPASRAAARPEPANAPLALGPTNDAPPAPAARNTRVQTAAATPTDRVAPGSYAQISSRKSEADARTAARVLQNKYASVLGDKQPVIRRADLGTKGIYYRVLVGPFGSTGEASQLCSSLKAAGGDCVVQRN